MSKLILRVKAFPWVLLIEAGLILRGRWRSLPARERARLVGLARASRGWPGNLSPNERAEVRRLITRLDTRTLAGEIVALRRATGKSGKGRSPLNARTIRAITLARRGR